MIQVVALAALVALLPPACCWLTLRRTRGAFAGLLVAVALGAGLYLALDRVVDAELERHRARWHAERGPVVWAALDQRQRRADLDRVEDFLAHGRFVDGMREGPPVMAAVLTLALGLRRVYQDRQTLPPPP